MWQWLEKSRDGKPIRQVYIGRDGQMVSICPSLTTYSCGACLIADNYLYLSPSYLLRCEKYRILYAWMLFIFHLIPMTDYRHWDRPKWVTSGEVSELSSRRSIAIAFFSACPRVCYGNKRTVQRRCCLLWGELRKQESSIRKWNLLVCW